MIDILIFNKPIASLETNSSDVFLKIDHLLKDKFDYYLLNNGHIFRQGDELFGNNIHVVPRCLGGKGGFGSMLRAIGAQIEKTTNREACRDLSGRRLRDINEEKRLKKWISEQANREREAAEKKKKKLEKLSREPKHEFSDAHYDQERSQMVEKVHSAVEEGLKACATSDDVEPSTSQGVKRKTEPPAKKKPKLWFDEEFDSDEEESDEGDDETVKKVKLSSSTL